MTHEQVLESFPEFQDGRLDQAIAVAIRDHLSSCAACAYAFSTFELLRDDAERASAEGHPSSKLLVEYALDARSLRLEEADRVARHIEQCSTCRDEARVTREAASATGRQAKVTAGRSRVWWSLAAAGITAAILGYPAIRGLRTLPSTLQEAERLEAELQDARSEVRSLQGEVAALVSASEDAPVFSGLVSYHALQPPLRGEEPIQEVAFDEGQSVVLVVLEFVPPSDCVGDTPVQFELGSLEAPAWTVESTAREAVRLAEAGAGLLGVAIPTSALVGGAQELRCYCGTGNARTLISSLPFKVQRPGS